MIDGPTLWVASDRGLLQVEGTDVVAHGKKQGLPANTISRLVPRGTDLLVSTAAGFSVGRPGSWEAVPKKTAPRASVPLAGGSGTWFVGERNVTSWSADGNSREHKLEPKSRILSSAVDVDRLVLLAAVGGGGERKVVEVHPDSPRSETLDFVPDTISARAVSVSMVDGVLWVGTHCGSYVRCTPEGARWFGRAHPLHLDHSLGDEIRGVHGDSSGSGPGSGLLWVQGIRHLDVVDRSRLEMSR